MPAAEGTRFEHVLRSWHRSIIDRINRIIIRNVRDKHTTGWQDDEEEIVEI